MLHELKSIVETAKRVTTHNIKCVLASVVALNGSSYRRPGVQMLILENGSTVGTVSGGCVEKEIVRQSQSVFKNNTPKLITYDGRYRLGCEGTLYILIEPFAPTSDFYKTFNDACSNRISFTIQSYFSHSEDQFHLSGSFFSFQSKEHWLRNGVENQPRLKVFSQKIKPSFQLIIVGSEHDSVELCKTASNLGWDVSIVTSPSENKSKEKFTSAKTFYQISESDFGLIETDNQTAIVFMTHSYAKDLKYLSKITHKHLPYIGLLGPKKRRDQILNQIFELQPDISEEFVKSIHGPAGLNIGAETPQEISLSIVSEILTVIRRQNPVSLKNKSGGIHETCQKQLF